MIEFRLTDTGPGIAPADQARIWGRNQRVSADNKGLGLYIVQQLVTTMGGEVGLESTLGAGSAFWARIPITHDQG